MLKRIIVTILAFSLLVISPAIQSQAFSSDNTQNNLVEVLLSQYDETIQIGDPKSLYNDEEKVIALLYPLYPQGYVVVETCSNRISEYSLSGTYPYVENETNYYNGPLQYYVKNNGMYEHVRTGQTVDAVSYRCTRIQYEEKMKQNDLEDALVVQQPDRSSYSLGTALRTFDYNPDGRCGSIAAAILFAYYDDAIDSSMVSSYLLSDSTGQIFSSYLKPHIEDLNTTYSGSTASDVVYGMSWYLANVGLSSMYSVLSASYPQFITYMNCINLGRPVITLVQSAPTYGNHWIVGYGYNQDTILHANFLIVNDGWGNNGININWVYVDSLVYLNYPD